MDGFLCEYILLVFALSFPVYSQYEPLIMKTSCYLMKLNKIPQSEFYQFSIGLVVMIQFFHNMVLTMNWVYAIVLELGIVYPILSGLWLNSSILYWDTHSTVIIYQLILLGEHLLSHNMVWTVHWSELAICWPCFTCPKVSKFSLKLPVNL